MGYEEIPIGPLREAFLSSGVSSCELARRLGWVRSLPDAQRVNRQLGLSKVDNGRGWTRRETTSYKRAVELARAIGVDPHDVGL